MARSKGGSRGGRDHTSIATSRVSDSRPAQVSLSLRPIVLMQEDRRRYHPAGDDAPAGSTSRQARRVVVKQEAPRPRPGGFPFSQAPRPSWRDLLFPG